MANDDYDPGTPYEPPSYRRRRQRGGEQDDAWAAANEDDIYDDGADIEDYAAGYVDHERSRQRDRIDSPDNWHDGEQWPSSVNRARERGRLSQHPRADRGQGYNRAEVYGRSPTYYRDRMKRGEYGEYHAEQDARQRVFSPYEPASGHRFNLPYWQVLIIVFLALGALFAVILACLTILLV